MIDFEMNAQGEIRNVRIVNRLRRRTVAETEYSKFRLGQYTLADLDALAASAGTRTQALREAVAYWRRAVEEAGKLNATELDELDWERLAQLNNPDPMPSEARDDEERSGAWDWSARLAQELVGMWEGRAAVLPAHKSEAKECRALAKRITGWGVLRGYALMACLRHFWGSTDTPKHWWEPKVWMTPAAR